MSTKNTTTGGKMGATGSGRKKRIFTEQDMSTYKDMEGRGATLQMIADKLGTSYTTLHGHLKRNGIAKNKQFIDAKCCVCGASKRVPLMRTREQKNYYCSRQCFAKTTRNVEFQAKRLAAGAAKRLLKPICCTIPKRGCIDWVDGDYHNNTLDNIILFKTKKDRGDFNAGLEKEVYLGKKKMWIKVLKIV